MSNRISVAYGDGIGPEIMQACLAIFEAAGAGLEIDPIVIGEKMYASGHSGGISDDDWNTLVRNKVFFKAPITTPQGGGFKSLNVTVRKTLGLYANVRPVRALHPFVHTRHPDMDLVIIRENEEDLYAGIEHRQTNEVYQCLKLMSRPGSEKIIRFAFEYARSAGRKKITCMSKDNIMKLTDGLFHKVFDEVAQEYPDIEADHWIIDIGTAKLADTPEVFDVIVLPNLYGDILSDVAGQIGGSVGLAGSANIGEACAMFEAIHGSAPPLAGKNVANPSGLLMGGVQMLNYLGKNEVAERVENAWLKTLEDGIHTADFHDGTQNRPSVSTTEFRDAVIERLGQKPSQLPVVSYPRDAKRIEVALKPQPTPKRECEGIDIFLFEDNRDPQALGERLEQAAEGSALELIMVTNRGVKVFPHGNPLTFCTDHWRCRFLARDSKADLPPAELLAMQQRLLDAGLDIIKTENLYRFDGQRGYSLGQGQ